MCIFTEEKEDYERREIMKTSVAPESLASMSPQLT